MLDSLRLAGRTAGIEDEQQGFAVQRLGGAVGRGVEHEVVPPEIAAGLHRRSAPPVRRSTMHFSTVGDLANAASTCSFTAICLPRRQPPSAVISNLAAGVLIPVGDGLGRKAAEDHAMHRADAAQASMATASSGTMGM